MDVLSDTLQTLKLKAVMYFHANFRAEWGMEIPKGKYANFHIVTSGYCWLTDHRGELRKLAPGDIAVFPNGDSHALACDPQADLVAADMLLSDPRTDTSDGAVEFGLEVIA